MPVFRCDEKQRAKTDTWRSVAHSGRATKTSLPEKFQFLKIYKRSCLQNSLPIGIVLTPLNPFFLVLLFHPFSTDLKTVVSSKTKDKYQKVGF